MTGRQGAKEVRAVYGIAQLLLLLLCLGKKTGCQLDQQQLLQRKQHQDPL
jgi:hypothetical protein